MRSQFILIFLIFLFISLYIFSNNIKNDYYIYEVNLEKYIAEDFRMNILNNLDNLTMINAINNTFYKECRLIGFTCYYNGYIAVISPTKIYIVNIT